MSRRPSVIPAIVSAIALVPVARAADLAAQVNGKTLHVTATVDDNATTQLMIDADGDARTGYAVPGYAGGFDTMIEGATVYHFKGNDPTQWTWDKAGAADRTLDGEQLTIDVGLDRVGGKSAAAIVVLRTLSADYQTVLATQPPAPGATVDLTGASKAATSQPAAPGFAATVAQDGTDLVVRITAATPADLNTVLVFFDTDGKSGTGFAPPADPQFGFEAMIQGGTLSRHSGATRDAWAWTSIAPIKQTVNGNAEELRFNASLLKATTLKVAAWQMSSDWQLRTNAWPKADGKADTARVPLDATKLHAALDPADVPVAPAHANAGRPPRQRFAAATSYACYYGADCLGPLSHVDAAILHTPAQTAANVGRLGALGVVTIGYLSVGEDETLRVGNGAGFNGKASWYFDKDRDGKPDENGTWGSYYANAADPAWRGDRVAEARRLCDEVGFDGVFLDTIETVDAYPASRDGMIQLVEELRAALPDKVIVINRGFSLLGEPRVSGNIDGLMYESFTDSYDFDSKSYLRFKPQDMDATRATMVSTVLPAMKQYKLRALALDYCQPDQADRIQEAFDRAATFGMLPAVAPISLDAVYDTANVVAHADPKYLAVQATPEAMQATLDAPRNGFPAGTIVRPSSCYMGYSAATVVDGVADHAGVNWTKAAWASAEEPGVAQQIAFASPEPIRGGTLSITFAYDNKAWFPSRDFTVDVSDDGQTWRTIAHPTGNADHEVRVPLPADAFRHLRIVQSPGGGSAERPNLMWVQQVARMTT